jgi:hypothetical protein
MTQIEYKKPATPMSPQTRQAIGIGGLVLCLLIGGGIVYWFLFGSTPSRREVAVDANQPINMRGRQMPTPRVSKTGAKDWAVRGDAGMMRVTQTGSGNDYKFNFGFQTGLLGLKQSQINLIAGRFRILNDAAMAKAWNITPEQLDKLKKIDLGGGGALKPSDPDRAEIRKLWADFQSASDKSEPQKKLVDKLDTIARNNLDASKKTILDRIEQISKILTAEQLEKISK